MCNSPLNPGWNIGNKPNINRSDLRKFQSSQQASHLVGAQCVGVGTNVSTAVVLQDAGKCAIVGLCNEAPQHPCMVPGTYHAPCSWVRMW